MPNNVQVQSEPTLLTSLAVGESAAIDRVEGERLQRMKLLDLGLTPGTLVSVMKIAPMGNPIEISVRNRVLTLRKEEAALVALEGAATGRSAQEEAR